MPRKRSQRRRDQRQESQDEAPRSGRQGQGWQQVFESWEEMVAWLQGTVVSRERTKLTPRTRPWITLTPAYRKRLERAGIHRLQYEWGYSLKQARGHGKTTSMSRLKKYRDVEVMFVAVWAGSNGRRMGSPPIGPDRIPEPAPNTQYTYRSLNYFLPLWWAWQEVVDEVMEWDEEDRDLVAYWVIESRRRMV